MNEYVTLMGSDDVARAGSTIRSAAEDMSRAAMNLAGALEGHQRWMDQWLERFAEVVAKAAPGAVKP